MFLSRLSSTLLPCQRLCRYSSSITRPSVRSSRRGGQNLSERYNKLAKSLRSKEHLKEEIVGLENVIKVDSPTYIEERYNNGTFRGLVIPKLPRPPASDECCMSGCAICIYDLYEDSKEAYRSSLSTFRSSLQDMGVPESEWPLSVRTGGTKEVIEKKNVTLNAFEELERALSAKRRTSSSNTL